MLQIVTRCSGRILRRLQTPQQRSRTGTRAREPRRTATAVTNLMLLVAFVIELIAVTTSVDLQSGTLPPMKKKIYYCNFSAQNELGMNTM